MLDLNAFSKFLQIEAKKNGVDPKLYKVGTVDYTGGRMKLTFDHEKKLVHISNER